MKIRIRIQTQVFDDQNLETSKFFLLEASMKSFFRNTMIVTIPDPYYYFHFDADPDPNLHSYVDPDLLLIKVMQICKHWSTDPLAPN
jgi:hypothetical protein